MQPDEQLVVAEKLFLADDKICAFCRDYFGMNLIGGEEAFDMFSKYEDSIYKYIYELSGEKAQWDKVEIDTKLLNVFFHVSILPLSAANADCLVLFYPYSIEICSFFKSSSFRFSSISF